MNKYLGGPAHIRPVSGGKWELLFFGQEHYFDSLELVFEYLRDLDWVSLENSNWTGN